MWDIAMCDRVQGMSPGAAGSLPVWARRFLSPTPSGGCENHGLQRRGDPRDTGAQVRRMGRVQGGGSGGSSHPRTGSPASWWKAVLLFFGAAVLTCCTATRDEGPTIRTTIVARCTIGQDGGLTIRGDVTNEGDGSAYNLVVTLLMGDWNHTVKGLGDNRPGEKVPFEIRRGVEDFLPGTYNALLRVDFEEQNGRPHVAYHVFSVARRSDRPAPCDPGIGLTLDPVHFNPKVFWAKTAKARLVLTNRVGEGIHVHMQVQCPDGLSVDAPKRSFLMGPGSERQETLVFSRGQRTRESGFYEVIVWYERGGVHCSSRIQGDVLAREKPVFFKWYLLGALGALAFAAVLLWLRGSPSSLQ